MTRAVTIIAFPTATQSDNRTRPKFLPADPPDVKVGKLGNWGTTHAARTPRTYESITPNGVCVSLARWAVPI